MGDRDEYKVFYNDKPIDLKGINIYPDDNIGLILKKISYVTKEPWTHLFAWYHRKVSKVQRDALIQTFIKNLFRSEKKLSIKKLCQATKSFFAINIDRLETEYNIVDIPQALEILREYTKSVQSIIEPLGFKYTYNGYMEYIPYDPFSKDIIEPPSIYNNELALTLQSFDIINNEIYIVNSKTITDKQYLFPFIDQKHDIQTTNTLIKDLIKIEDSIEAVDISDLNNNGFINFIHIHADSDKMNIDLVKAFEYLHTSDTITFIKLKLKTNAFYKVHETFIEPLANDKELYKKLIGISASSNNQSEYIMFRIKLGLHSSATIIFFENGSYDIRLNFNMKAQETKANVTKYLDLINIKVISEITKATRKIITKLPNDILDNKYDDCYIVKTVLYGQITSKNFQFKFSNFPAIIRSKLFPYFDVIPNPDKNILHLQYKKVDNYAQYDNVRSFIAQHFGMDKDDLIAKLAENFTLTIEEAEKQLDLWKISNEVELVQIGPENRYYKPKYDSFVNVKIRINSTIDLRYLVTGAKNAQVYDRISWLLKKLAKMSINSYKQKDEEFLKNFNKYIGMGQGDTNDKVTFADIEKEEDAVSIPDYSNELSDEIDEDLLALENEFAEDVESEPQRNVMTNKSPQSQPKENDSNDATVGLKRKGELLRKLHEADERLFTYKVNKGEKRRDYASLCGSVGMRQPVVVNKDELDRIEKKHKGAIEGYVKSGSTVDLAKKNYYICPSIWCPKSRVAITYDEYVKAGNKCPFPDINEEPVLFQSQSFWGVGELALKRKRYPSFLDMYTHPEQLCLPCCYKTAPSSGNRNKKRQEICKSNYEPNVNINTRKDDGVIEDVVGNERYIKAETFSPLDIGRYGVVPSDVHKVLGLNHCGPRHDGTGVIQNGSTCYLRKGIAHGKQSFMSCMNYVLGIQNIKDRILTNLTIDKFLSMENGRLLKLFIDESLDMENKDTYTEFITWLQSQKNYIAKFNLTRFIERQETAPKELLREFLIWGAFKKFKAYLAEDSIEKDHLVLLDLVNLGIEWLNPNKIYCIVIEVDAVNGKAYVLCPSRAIGDDLDRISIIIKRNGYYEPLIKVEHIPKQPLKEEHILNIRSDAAMRHLISFFIKNCRIKDEKKKNIRAYLESKGYDVRNIVIDYDYKICGFILKNNLYIPLFNRDAVFTESIGSGITDRYIYFNEIPRFKCTLKPDEVKKIFDLVRKYSGDNRYIINSWIRGVQAYNGFLINDYETFIPLYLDNKSTTFESFDDDLNIFIGDDDIISKLSRFLQNILDKDENSEIKQEIMFLMDTGNMIPYDYRIKKLHTIMKKISINIPDNLIKDVTEKVARRILPSHSMMTISASRFNAMNDEFVLSYRDIKNGKIFEIWELQKNPFKHISETLFNMEIHSYELDDNLNLIIENNTNDIMQNVDYEDVPVKYQKKILKGFVVAKQRDYNKDTLANLFVNLSKNRIDTIVLEGNVKKAIMEDFINDTGRDKLVDIFQSNPRYMTIWKKSKSLGMLDSYIESLDHMNYLPSFYEAIIYAKVCKVNLITLGHTTIKNPDGFKVFMSSPDIDKYLLLKHTYDRFNIYDRFDIITMKNRKDPIFKMADFSTEFAEMINKKKLGEFEIEVEI